MGAVGDDQEVGVLAVLRRRPRRGSGPAGGAVLRRCRAGRSSLSSFAWAVVLSSRGYPSLSDRLVPRRAGVAGCAPTLDTTGVRVRWSEQVESVTGIEAWNPVETDLVLDLAREVAHGTERRFAPLTAYALGVAVGQQLGESADEASAREDALRALVVALIDAVEDRTPA